MVILLISTVIAIFRGFVREVISLASLVAAFWLAAVFFNEVALLLPSGIDETTLRFGSNEIQMSKLRAGIAFASIVIVILVAGTLLGHILGKVTRMPVLRGVDRVFGAVFGFARGAAVVVLVILVAAMTNFPRSETWASSRLLPLFEPVVLAAIDLMPQEYARYFSLGDTEATVSSYSL